MTTKKPKPGGSALRAAPHHLTSLDRVFQAADQDVCASAELLQRVFGLALKNKKFMLQLARGVADLAMVEPHFNVAVRNLVKAPNAGRQRTLFIQHLSLLLNYETLIGSGKSPSEAKEELAGKLFRSVKTIENSLTAARKVLSKSEQLVARAHSRKQA